MRFSRGTTVLLLIPLALVISSIFALFQGDRPCDDTFIHLRFVKNLVEHDQFTYNLDEPTYSTTSPLWNLAVALPARIASSEGINYLLRARIVTVVFALLAAAALLLYARVAHHDTLAWIMHKLSRTLGQASLRVKSGNCSPQVGVHGIESGLVLSENHTQDVG